VGLNSCLKSWAYGLKPCAAVAFIKRQKEKRAKNGAFFSILTKRTGETPAETGHSEHEPFELRILFPDLWNVRGDFLLIISLFTP
jgi:hypothetical protein